MLNERTTGWRWRPVTWVVPSTLALAVATGAPTRAETIHVPGDSTVHESLLPSYGPGKDTVVYNVRAFIDGRSRLTLNDDTARWRHLDNAAPGRWGCPPGRPTIINTVEWFPEWPDAPDCENRNCNCFSDVHEGVTVLRNETPRDVTLTPIECRSSCSIIELPEQSNGYRLVVEFDDNAAGGPEWYEILVELEYEPCLADLDGSKAVDFGDIVAILVAWGNPEGPEDLDGSGVVDFGDLIVLLTDWGPCTTGACCFDDGTCTDDVGEVDCGTAGGVYRGPFTTCATTCLGACCLDDGTCSEGSVESDCLAGGGFYRGDASTCAGDCHVGACCLIDGCVEVIMNACESMGGDYQGDGTICTGTCLGACCLADASCVEATAESECLAMSGRYRGDGNTCAGGCPTGACCVDGKVCVDGLTLQACRMQGGVYEGDGSTCEPDCPLDPCGLPVVAPVTLNVNLCDEADTCSLRPGPDMRWEVTIPTSGNWTFRSCGTIETVLSVDTVDCCGGEYQVRTYCSSAVTIDLAAGQVVFATVEAVGACGTSALVVTGP